MICIHSIIQHFLLYRPWRYRREEYRSCIFMWFTVYQGCTQATNLCTVFIWLTPFFHPAESTNRHNDANSNNDQSYYLSVDKELYTSLPFIPRQSPEKFWILDCHFSHFLSPWQSLYPHNQMQMHHFFRLTYKTACYFIHSYSSFFSFLPSPSAMIQLSFGNNYYLKINNDIWNIIFSTEK